MSNQGYMVSLVLFALLVVIICPFIGMTDIPVDTVLHPDGSSTEATIFWKIRVPRIITAFIAGAVLALSGMAFQAMFRNPLATPFTLGVSSGASLGAVIFMRLGFSFTLGIVSGVSIGAFIGALMSILLVYGLVRFKGGFTTSRLLLAGIAISFFFSSLIMFVHYTSNIHDTFRLMRWLMGNLAMVGYDAVIQLVPFGAAGIILLVYMMNQLNLMATGEDLAMSRGVDVNRTRHILFFAVSMMVGTVVAMCGPIGFVGLMAPHICRLMVGNNHRYLLPATFLFGGAFLVLCDTIARTVVPPAEIPVGVITALLGGPFFIWLLLRKSNRDTVF